MTNSKSRRRGEPGRVPQIGASVGEGEQMAVDATDDDVVAPLDEAAAPPASGIATVVITAGLDMDPRLQRLIALRSGGESTPATASSMPGEIPVTALVTDFQAWHDLSEVRAGIRIGDDGRGGTVVTGRIPLDRIEAVRRSPFVQSLKAARQLRPSLSSGVPETRADPASLGSGLKTRGGAGAVVGIIDFGCDFQHENFRERSGATRIEALWHQGGSRSANSPYGYGRLYERSDIDGALRQSMPYSALGYGPARDTSAAHGTHGTHVMDIATGNGNGSGVPGFAPEATIIFVDVSSNDIAWRGPEVVGTSFGDSVRLLEAARFIFDRAGDRPCVINISLGTNGGPHDGTTLVERGLDILVREAPNRAVVIAASNSYADGIHASGTIPEAGMLDLDWSRPAGTGGQDEMEIWYGGGDAFDAELFMPDGTSLGVVGPGQNGEVRDASGRVDILVSSRRGDPTNGDNMIGIYVRDGLPFGQWRVRLTGRSVGVGAFHAWIERDDTSQSSFLSHRDDAYSVGSISCGHETIVVGSYDGHKASTPISYFSSSGPTRDSREKPDLAAPGHAVLAAHSRTRKDVTIKSGTSMAAPAVAGGLALILAEAAARSIKLTGIEQRDLLTRTARKVPSQVGWDPRWGAGRLDVAACVAELSRPSELVAEAEPVAAVTKPKRNSPPANERGKRRLS